MEATAVFVLHRIERCRDRLTAILDRRPAGPFVTDPSLDDRTPEQVVMDLGVLVDILDELTLAGPGLP